MLPPLPIPNLISREIKHPILYIVYIFGLLFLLLIYQGFNQSFLGLVARIPSAKDRWALRSVLQEILYS